MPKNVSRPSNSRLNNLLRKPQDLQELAKKHRLLLWLRLSHRLRNNQWQLNSPRKLRLLSRKRRNQRLKLKNNPRKKCNNLSKSNNLKLKQLLSSLLHLPDLKSSPRRNLRKKIQLKRLTLCSPPTPTKSKTTRPSSSKSLRKPKNNLPKNPLPNLNPKMILLLRRKS